MALLPTLLALAIGVVLGIHWGGSPHNVLEWRPQLWQVGLAGLSLVIVADLSGLTGTPAVLLRILALALVLWFAVVNVRTGGMVLVIAGVGVDLVVTVLNWGMPVSTSALVSSGLLERAGEADEVVLSGGRELADGALLGALGDTIPLPWGQVVSLGDLLWLTGLALVTASVLRRYEVPPRGRRAGPSYGDSMSALSRGPAPRRGPGLHPSRMSGRRRPHDDG